MARRGVTTVQVPWHFPWKQVGIVVLVIAVVTAIVIPTINVMTNVFSGSPVQISPEQAGQVSIGPAPEANPPAETKPNKILVVPWNGEQLAFPGDRVDKIFVKKKILYAIQLPWQGELGQVWTSQNQGTSWDYWGKEVTPDETQLTPINAKWGDWTEEFSVRIFPQLEVNPDFLPPVTGRVVGGLEWMVQDGSILFATIYDGSSNDELGRIPARRSRRIIVSTDLGISWTEYTTPRPLRIDYVPSLAIGEHHLYLANEGTLWRFPPPTKSSP